MKDFGSYSKEQIDTLNNANDKLGLSNNMNIERNKNIIFVYSSPKVGSTSLVSSLRLSLNDKYVILHIHNEKMLKSLYDIRDIQVIDIIEYNRYLGKNIHVFDIYRSIMEQRMSLFFENIDTFHFNVSKERLCKYDVQILINRFNKICSHLLITDHFKTYYNVDFPEVFDHDKKYLLLERNGINFVKLRLQDSSEWSLILNRILHEDIIMIKDYQTNDKVIKDVYNNFKLHYKIPENIYNLLVENQELKYYYTDEERSQYLSSWNNKITSSIPYYSEVEYKVYIEVSIANRYQSEIQYEHYFDDGCNCQGCNRQRKIVLTKLKQNKNNSVSKINHLLSLKNKLEMEINKKLRGNIRSARSKSKHTIGLHLM
jgi:hypothetical protein|tara:strand:+ start:4624 stop:5736 length:1113 start_codon:yes stop_codon:yes gene_type:complete